MARLITIIAEEWHPLEEIEARAKKLQISVRGVLGPAVPVDPEETEDSEREAVPRSDAVLQTILNLLGNVNFWPAEATVLAVRVAKRRVCRLKDFVTKGQHYDRPRQDVSQKLKDKTLELSC